MYMYLFQQHIHEKRMYSILDKKEDEKVHVHLHTGIVYTYLCLLTKSSGACLLWLPFIGERERANLVVQLARFFCIYIYIYPALMYAVISNSATTVRFFSTPRVSRQAATPHAIHVHFRS